METLKPYKGKIVGLYTNSHDLGYDTSYHAVIWDWSQLNTFSVCYNDTRQPTGVVQNEIDATADVLEAYQTYQAICQYKSAVMQLQVQTSQPNKTGLLCLIARGRTAKGSIVTIKKLYNNDTYNRMLVSDQKGTVYEVYAKNLDVLAYPIDINNYIPLIKPKYSAALIALYGDPK